MPNSTAAPTKYDAAVTMNGITFYRVGRTVICIDAHETTIDRYANAEAAQMVLDMAAE